MSARLRRMVACAVITTAATPAAASAAWTLPVDLTAPARSIVAPELAYWPDGTALVTWRGRPRSARDGERALTNVATLGTDGRRTRLLAVREQIVARPYGRRSLALLRQRTDASDGTVLRLSAALGTRTRGGSRVQTIARSSPAARIQPNPSLAVRDDGETAIAWAELRDQPRRAVVRLAVRPAGGRFGRPATVAAGRRGTSLGPSAPVVAHGPDGELLVAYSTARIVGDGQVGSVAVRTRSPRGTLGRPTTLGPAGVGGGLPSLAVGASGRAVVAWSSGGSLIDHVDIRAAVRRARHRSFLPAQVLDLDSDRALSGHVAIAIAPEGTATLAWGGSEGREARVATAGADGRFGGITRLGQGFHPDVAVRGDGTTVVAFRTSVLPALPGPGFPAPAQRIVAYLRPAHAAQFLPLEFVSGLEAPAAASDVEPRVAFAGPSGRAAVLWPAAALGGQPLQRLADTAVLRLATRSP